MVVTFTTCRYLPFDEYLLYILLLGVFVAVAARFTLRLRTLMMMPLLICAMLLRYTCMRHVDDDDTPAVVMMCRAV
jgi:hypothetical protein